MKGIHKEIHQNYFLVNNQIFSSEVFSSEEITKTTSVYEVIRIIDGVALFLEEHIDRLNQSFQLLGFDFYVSHKDIEKQIQKLIEINQCYNYNVKLIVNNLNTKSPNVYLFFIESNYPHPSLYEKGVHTILYRAERENPNAKVVLQDFRQKVQEAIIRANAFEAILVNHENYITEGSRSNVFVVKDHRLFTPPKGQVLKGVTRSQIISLCRNLSLDLQETVISLDFLKSAEGVFITGTSPKVLPVASIDNFLYPSAKNPLILQVRRAYDDLIRQYIDK